MRPETLQRIEEAMRQLSYQPNRAALQLKTGHSDIIGLLVPSIANPSFAALALALEKEARDSYGYRLLLGNTHRDREEETRFLDDLLSHGVRGMIAVASDIAGDHFRAAVRRGVSVIDYDGRTAARAGSRQMPIDSVSMDNVRAGEIAARHLIDVGCVSLAFLSEAGQIESRRDKMAGFRRAAQQAGVAAQVVEKRAADEFGDASMVELGRELGCRLAQMKQRPDGVVCINDMLAIGLLSSLRDCDVRVPEDICVVGIDDIFLAPLVTPPLTSVRPPLAELARLMVDRIVARQSDPDLPGQEFLLAPVLSARASTRRPGQGQ